ncbi:isochorismatase family protein [Streptomyces coelicoflavus]|uniref:Isochorismatase family protein n=1 Tax=Streptomyces coelicoflavus TaxID=285562 RepID=A0A7K3PDJ7_9ACTN|nr:isochorismatase family protein [Streptomyces coelicoflavus]NEB08060.1 isochorismatase family protein [Streptomyces coelicoflavus]
MAGIPEIRPYPMPSATELPAGVVDWSVDPDRAVLLVHDLQKFFLSPFPAGEQPVTDLVRNAGALRDRCAALGAPVAYTAQPGGMSPEQRGLLADFWGPGMTPSPEHREVVNPVAPAPGDWMLTKWRYSAFFRTDLLRRMRDAGRDQLVICGVYAHVGVLTTAIEAFTHDIQPFLVADAVADFGPAEHRMALEYAAGRCAAVVTTGELLAGLPAGRASTAKEPA